MPIATKKPTEPTLIVNTPKIKAKEALTPVVDTKYVPKTSLIAFVEGSSWTVTYYSQVLDKHNDVRSQDPTQSAVYQQYHEIKNLEIKVTSALSQSFDDATSTMVVTGTALIQSFLIPNFGDMFAADVGDGREGVFTITSMNKKTILKDSIYEVEYRLTFYTDAEPARRADLVTKTIASYNYLKEFLIYNQNPLLIDSDYNAYTQLFARYRELSQNYMSWFFSRKFSSLTVPSQVNYIYDNNVVKTVLSILTTQDAPEIRYVRKLNITENVYFRQPTVFDALLQRDYNLLRICNKQMGLAAVSQMHNDAMFDGVKYTGYTHLIYPLDADTSFNCDNDADPLFAEDVLVDSPYGKSVPIPSTITIGNNTINFLPTTDFTTSYVFSPDFYDESILSLSLIEALTRDYLQKREISYSTLLALVDNHYGWTTLQRFYYIPVLLILIKSTIRNF